MADLFSTASTLSTNVVQNVAYTSLYTSQSAGGLTLGNILFSGTEIPENVRFGLKEQMRVHKMIGGARIIDMVGDDPSDISWTGFFLGPLASERAHSLYALQQQKQLLVLTYGSFTANVVISSLDLVYKKKHWIDFTITCVVIDQANSVGGVLTNAVASVSSALASAVGNASGALTPILNTVNTGLSAVTTSSQAASNLVSGVKALGNSFSGLSSVFSYF